ncbi:hypothetical protein K458DRAFT_386750 [Lentithecium fluviatile CBS 122367]|uniref:Uncharacterized protein n=1 Tax=Lentithecium fluviatile CBS 122367 TaxID=1168545 RepID=A0A6G1J8E3_9PLEO|nr:hypothetical protein K458DRAFT_386750 [Lentithecium fluviatile CBS 122367]
MLRQLFEFRHVARPALGHANASRRQVHTVGHLFTLKEQNHKTCRPISVEICSPRHPIHLTKDLGKIMQEYDPTLLELQRNMPYFVQPLVYHHDSWTFTPSKPFLRLHIHRPLAVIEDYQDKLSSPAKFYHLDHYRNVLIISLSGSDEENFTETYFLPDEVKNKDSPVDHPWRLPRDDQDGIKDGNVREWNQTSR